LKKQTFKLIPPLIEATFLDKNYSISDDDFEETSDNPIRYQHGKAEDYLIDDLDHGGQYIMLKDDFEDMYEPTNFIRKK